MTIVLFDGRITAAATVIYQKRWFILSRLTCIRVWINEQALNLRPMYECVMCGCVLLLNRRSCQKHPPLNSYLCVHVSNVCVLCNKLWFPDRIEPKLRHLIHSMRINIISLFMLSKFFALLHSPGLSSFSLTIHLIYTLMFVRWSFTFDMKRLLCVCASSIFQV